MTEETALEIVELLNPINFLIGIGTICAALIGLYVLYVGGSLLIAFLRGELVDAKGRPLRKKK